MKDRKLTLGDLIGRAGEATLRQSIKDHDRNAQLEAEREAKRERKRKAKAEKQRRRIMVSKKLQKAKQRV